MRCWTRTVTLPTATPAASLLAMPRPSLRRSARRLSTASVVKAGAAITTTTCVAVAAPIALAPYWLPAQSLPPGEVAGLALPATPPAPVVVPEPAALLLLGPAVLLLAWIVRRQRRRAQDRATLLRRIHGAGGGRR